MPKFNTSNDGGSEKITTSNYEFSAVRIDELGSTEQTLVTIAVDKSGSLHGQDRNLEKMVSEAVKSCKKSDRAESIIVRVIAFDHNETEIHGFKQLNSIDPDSDYANTINTGGGTALFDAAHNAVISTAKYGEMLVDQDFAANAIIFLITDGCDEHSTLSSASVAKAVKDTRVGEMLDSIAIVLVGMTDGQYATSRLNEFKNEAELDEYIEMGDVTTQKLAKLAGYVSRSVSSTSQALGTGGPSTSLSF